MPVLTSGIARLRSNCTAGRACTAELRVSFRRISARDHCLFRGYRTTFRLRVKSAFIRFLPHAGSHIHPVKLVEPVRNNPEALDPTWRRWIDLVELAVAEAQQPAWAGCVHLLESRPPDAPLLHNATLRVNHSLTRDLVRRLAHQLGIVGARDVDPLAVVLGGVERDDVTIDTLASKLAVPNDTVAVLAQLSALPLLLNAARALSPEASRSWQRGYCPVCGAWPALVEMRGIQRERRMRCGCCGGDWLLPVLRCAFCDEIDHKKLGFLLTEDGDQQLRVETCSTCRGYLKTLTTLGTLPFTTLAAKDMSTITFDLAARDRGYSRPSRPGWSLSVEIVQ